VLARQRASPTRDVSEMYQSGSASVLPPCSARSAKCLLSATGRHAFALAGRLQFSFASRGSWVRVPSSPLDLPGLLGVWIASLRRCLRTMYQRCSRPGGPADRVQGDWSTPSFGGSATVGWSASTAWTPRRGSTSLVNSARTPRSVRRRAPPARRSQSGRSSTGPLSSAMSPSCPAKRGPRPRPIGSYVRAGAEHRRGKVSVPRWPSNALLVRDVSRVRRQLERRSGGARCGCGHGCAGWRRLDRE
jgi:hypothetical protein